MAFKWPDNWKEVPALAQVDDSTTHFSDRTSKKVDAIILCTGYKHHFPFLPHDLRLKTATAWRRKAQSRTPSTLRANTPMT